jgi:hypothetical protein
MLNASSRVRMRVMGSIRFGLTMQRVASDTQANVDPASEPRWVFSRTEVGFKVPQQEAFGIQDDHEPLLLALLRPTKKTNRRPAACAQRTHTVRPR